MRTTIDLPDELLRQAKAKAAIHGIKLKDLITRYVEQGLRVGALPAAVPPALGAVSFPWRERRQAGLCPL
jgi:hypothetical protein